MTHTQITKTSVEKWSYRYVGTTSEALKNPTLVERHANGEEKQKGERTQKTFPGAALGFVAMMNSSNEILIDMDMFEDKNHFNSCVKAFSVPKEKGGIYLDADINDSSHPFWGKAIMEMSYDGGTLDMSNPVDVMTVAVARKLPIFWFKDKKRPRNLDNVLFIVEELGADRKVILSNDDEVGNYANLFRELIGLSDRKIALAARAMNIQVIEGEPRVNVENLIFEAIKEEPTATVFTDDTRFSLIGRLTSMKEDLTVSLDLVNKARHKGIITKPNGSSNYEYKKMVLGRSYEACAEFLVENVDISKKILTDLKEMNGS